jgi:hypothetical protein
MYFETYPQVFSRRFSSNFFGHYWRSFFCDSCTCGKGITSVRCVGSKTSDYVMWDVLHRIYQGVLEFKNFMRFHGTHVNAIYACKKSTACPALIITTLTDARRHYLKNFYSEFYPNGIKNMGSTVRNSVTPMSML